MEILTVEDVSKKTNKSVKTIRRQIAEGSLKASKINNRYRISVDDFNDWYEKYKNGICKESIFDDVDYVNVDSKKVNFIDISKEWKRDGWKNKNERNGLNFIDLFSGAGGLSCGLVMAGWNPIGSVEIMDQAVSTYKYNFVDKKGFNENVESRDIRETDVKRHLYDSVWGQNIDLIVGGFPCQGFSMAGNRIVTDKRNTLYLDMLEIVDHLRPKVVVMENVPGLRSMLGGKVEEKIINDFENIGYKINVTVLNAADYYTPQTRRRVIFIGNRIGVDNYHPQPILSPDKYITTKDAISDLMNMKPDPLFNHVPTTHSEDMQKKLMAVKEGESLYKNYSDSWKKCPWNKPSCTVKENHGGVNIHPKLPRVLTAREMARLQSFPDDFVFQGSKKWQLTQIGNAVPCYLGKAIGLSVEKMIENEKNS
ncbi:MAG: DNA cytosine methyltransferase [Bacilli bacterium]|nr:DNA cytosine methyltransferase [Bacilli bacterium]